MIVVDVECTGLDPSRNSLLIGYTLGDRDTQESQDLFSFYALCDEALQDAGLIP